MTKAVPPRPGRPPSPHNGEVGVRIPTRIVGLDAAAKYLDMPRSTLRDQLAAGQIPGARKVGNRWKLSLDVVDQWFAAVQPSLPRSEAS